MRIKISLLITTLLLMLAGCSGGTEPTSNNAAIANTNAAATPATNTSVLEPVKTPQTGATNDAPTLGPVIQAYYDALKRKDAAGVRKVMEAEFLRSTEADMKAEKKTDLIAFLTEYDKLPEGKMQVRNEQISGNRGTVEVKGGTYVDWAKLTLVNEGGSWKLSNQVSK